MPKLQKKILIFLVVLTFISPLGLLLPKYLNSSGAWGEWSADTLNRKIGYTPKNIQHYSKTKKTPLTDYSLNSEDKSILHQSFYYVISGIVGISLTLVITYFISKKIIKNDK